MSDTEKINQQNHAYWTDRASGYSEVNQEELAGIQKKTWSDLLDREIQGVGKLPVHLGWVASLHKVWSPAAALEEGLKLGMGNAGQHCGVCNFVSV